MGNLLHFTTVLVTIIWAIGFFALSAGPVIHVLLFIAFISMLLGIVQTNSKFE
jgi:hypothetical protein